MHHRAAQYKRVAAIEAQDGEVIETTAVIAIPGIGSGQQQRR